VRHPAGVRRQLRELMAMPRKKFLPSPSIFLAM
jgi:hypothetical protein